jgi:hypothetical protein
MATKIDFDILSIENLNELKAEINKIIKEKKAAKRALEIQNSDENAELARNTIKPGNKIVFRYKEDVVEGIVLKLNAKTFTVTFTLNKEDKVLVRAYHLFVKLIDA